MKRTEKQPMTRISVPLAVLALVLGACDGGASTEPSPPVVADSSGTQIAVTSAAPELPGKEVATVGRCFGCHTTLGAKAAGPTWLALSGSERLLESGETVIADDAYLERSIVDPAAQIVAGFSNTMPGDYDDTFSEQEISDLIEYIKSLD